MKPESKTPTSSGVIGLISSYTLSEARMANDASAAAARAQADVGDGAAAPWTFEGLLRELVDADSYPHLFRVAWSKDLTFAPSGNEEHEAFLFGLERILDGVQAFADRAHTRHRVHELIANSLLPLKATNSMEIARALEEFPCSDPERARLRPRLRAHPRPERFDGIDDGKGPD